MATKRPTKFKTSGKVKRYAGTEGSEVESEFSPEQEKWLGGADRTDPYILSRMRSAVPNKAPVRDANPGKTPATLRAEEEADNKADQDIMRGETMLKEMRDNASAELTPRPRLNVKPSTKPTAIATAPSKSSSSPSKPASSGSDESWNTVTPEEKARRSKMESDQGLVPVRPEEYLIGGPGLKTVASLAKSAAKYSPREMFEAGKAFFKGSSGKTAGKNADYITPELTYTPKPSGPAPQLPGPRPQLPGPTKRLTGPSTKSAGEVESAGREEVTNPMMWAAGPKNAKNFKEPKPWKGEGESEWKRGGKVKKFAKGGSVSSASSRGDGIAIRGKTKGTMAKMCGGGMYKGKK